MTDAEFEIPSLPSDAVVAEFDNGWLTIWFNRPDKRNALSDDVTQALWAVLDAARPSRQVRGISLRGKGGVFCAGGDIKGFQSALQAEGQSVADVAEVSALAGRLFETINTMPQPVIMLVEGAAMAGGLGIVCAGDVVIVTQDARFALTETTLGIPPAQIAPFVVARLGLSTARRLMLTAARFEGDEAGRIGLADFVAKDVAAAEAIEADIKKNVLRCAPNANAITKELVLAAPLLEREAMIAKAGEGFAKAMLSEEGREGVASFIEKRKPNWSGGGGA